MSAAGDSLLVITRHFEVPPERVFDAWCERDQWQAWIGPEGMACEVLELDAVVGGMYRVSMRMSHGQVVPVAGKFLAVERPTMLQFSWGWDGDPARQSFITLTFTAKGEGTEMTLVQEGLQTVPNRDAHEKGWEGALRKLERFLSAKAA